MKKNFSYADLDVTQRIISFKKTNYVGMNLKLRIFKLAILSLAITSVPLLLTQLRQRNQTKFCMLPMRPQMMASIWLKPPISIALILLRQFLSLYSNIYYLARPLQLVPHAVESHCQSGTRQ